MKFSITANLAIVVLLCISNNLHADTFQLAIYHEHNGENRASGAAVMAGGPVLKFGLSLNEVTSDIALETNDRHYIYPVYVFGQISLDTKISPYFEFGSDLGELIIDELVNGDEDGGGIDVGVDVYWSLGLKTKFNRSIDIAAYAKWYHLEYQTDQFTPFNHVNLTTFGAQMLIQF